MEKDNGPIVCRLEGANGPLGWATGVGTHALVPQALEEPFSLMLALRVCRPRGASAGFAYCDSDRRAQVVWTGCVHARVVVQTGQG
jgi:hypothetical protein